MATLAALNRGPLVEASGSAWSRKWPEKTIKAPRELAPLEEEFDEEGGQLELVDEDGNDESTYVDTDSYSHFRAFRLEASPGEYKKIEENMISSGSVPRPPPPMRTTASSSSTGPVGLLTSGGPEGDYKVHRADSTSADARCETMASLAPTGRPAALDEDCKGEKYDMFLSHLQRNAQDTIISLQMFLKEVRPSLKFFIDVDVDMSDGLHETLRKGVVNCKAFLFFITDGILGSMWCAQELRWAVEYGKNIVLVRETDERHGGMEMKDFFEQVPEDLLPVFKNNIAIPWYREKGFRGVSVHAILKRAQLEDDRANELQKLQSTKRQLMAVVKLSKSSTTAFDVLQQKSVMLKIVIFMGGLGTFKWKWAQHIYNVIFNVSFWTCGAVCASNLIYAKTPYHNFPTDALTAYVHFPAWQSWYAWRKYVQTKGCAELLFRAKSSPEREAKLDLALRLGGWIVLTVQCAMVADVLAGFALPQTLVFEQKGFHEFHKFASVHALIMWVVIPPVVAAMFASYVMFAFVALLHILDIMATEDLLSKCIEPLAGYYEDSEKTDTATAAGKRDPGDGSKFDAALTTPRSRMGGDTASRAGSTEFGGSQIADVMENMQEFQRQAALEESLFRTVAELLVFLVDGLQSRIDHTSKAVGGLWVHLVFFSVMQVLAISASLVALGTSHADQDFKWWWGLQDFFHLGGGLVLLIVAMGVFCIVTATLGRVPRYVFNLLAGAGVPISRRASMVSLLGTRPYGMRVGFGFILVDLPKACGFFFVLLLVLVDKLVFVVSILTQYQQSP